MLKLNEFLDRSHAFAAITVSKPDVVFAVLGNEACDLDSAVSTIIYAMLVAEINQVETLPVLNIPSDDFPLRTEVVFFFRRMGVNVQKLLFRDTVDLLALKSTSKLRLILVDHNILQQSDQQLEDAVVEVVDHHRLERLTSDAKLLVEPVGSCCTLIAEQLLNLKPELLDETIATLLYGTILLDTVNLSSAAKRATEKDYEVCNRLRPHVGDISDAVLYEELLCAKKDISGLNSSQILRKDMKAIETETLSIALSSLPMSARLFLTRPDVTRQLREFSADRYNAVVILGIEIDNGVPTRDLAVYSSSTQLRNELSRVLEGCCDPSLQLTRTSSYQNTHIVHYNQGNTTASRKVVLPVLKAAAQNIRVYIENSPASASLSVRAQESTGGAFLQSDPGSSQNSSSYNSCPYTPQNSCAEDGDTSSGTGSASGCIGVDLVLPSFNSREMMEKIESKRVLLGFSRENDDEMSLLAYPFTPKNSFVESNFDNAYQQLSSRTMDVDALVEKLKGKQFYED